MAEMKFNYHILRVANFYYFLFNLTKWHFSCRDYIADYWLKRTGPLSTEESKVIKELTLIFKKHKFSLWPNFLCEEVSEAIQNLEKSIPQNEVELFSTAFVIFELRFYKVWEIEGENIKKWKGILNKKDTKGSLIKPKLDAYFGMSGTSEINVLLLLGGDNAAGGGGANIKQGWVEQEIGLKATEPMPFILVFWHEYIHHAYRRTIQPIIDKYLHENKIEDSIYKLGYKGSTGSILNEPITSQLFPNGYLALKHFGTNAPWRLSESFLDWLKKQPKNVYSAQKYISARNFEQIKDYFENGKEFDQSILKEVHEGYKEYIKFMDDKENK
jgi:hypothetical protein